MEKIEFEDPQYSGTRLRLWVANQMDAFGVTIDELKEELGYERTSAVTMLLDGRLKFPWKALPKLSRIFKTDPTILIALFVDQEADEEIKDYLFTAALRITPEWEFPVLKTLRNIYIDNPNSIWTYTPDHHQTDY